MTSRISLLDNRLANQIAAGEVVERPASVTKELVENSIDAGATRVEVDVERGGTRLIRITDNGSGIHKNDLKLALTRHATSKIHTTDDLSNIRSLGFRGEALASISSVSRLTLTSRTADSELAWQAIAQGRDMAVEILPASAAVGTRIEVADLFFNTPARQKFLRTEKTEFNHIEEVFKRQALANFAIAFVLKHNHKVVKRVPAVAEAEQYNKRVAVICGQPFVNNSVNFECEHESIRIWGWLGKPDFHRSESDIQYVFINRRPVKDKTLNHAIRQAYEGVLPAGRMPTFVIFLEIDAQQVDVNVHPTKHEVRFSEQRLIHDLLAKSVAEALSNCQTPLPIAEEVVPGDEQRLVAESSQVYMPANDSVAVTSRAVQQPSNAEVRRRHQQMFSQRSASAVENTPPVEASESLSDGFESGPARAERAKPTPPQWLSPPVSNSPLTEQHHFLLQISPRLWVTELDGKLLAVDSELLLKDYVSGLVKQRECQICKPLLFPQRIQLDNELIEDYANHQLLQRFGFRFQTQDDSSLVVSEIPLWLQSLPLQEITSAIPDWLKHYQQDSQDYRALADLMLAGLGGVDELVVAGVIGEYAQELPTLNACRVITADSLSNLFL